MEKDYSPHPLSLSFTLFAFLIQYIVFFLKKTILREKDNDEGMVEIKENKSKETVMKDLKTYKNRGWCNVNE